MLCSWISQRGKYFATATCILPDASWVWRHGGRAVTNEFLLSRARRPIRLLELSATGFTARTSQIRRLPRPNVCHVLLKTLRTPVFNAASWTARTPTSRIVPCRPRQSPPSMVNLSPFYKHGIQWWRYRNCTIVHFFYFWINFSKNSIFPLNFYKRTFICEIMDYYYLRACVEG